MNLMNQYFVFLGFLPLPVTPEKIEMSVPNLNKTTTLVDLGEINVVRGSGLTEISFDMLLPSFKYPFANYSFGSFSTSQAIGYLEYLKQTGATAYFIVTRCRKGIPSWWTNIRVTLEDFKVLEDANNGTDVVVSINLKEYREYSTKLATVNEEGGKITATFDNTRPITGNIAPYLGNYKKILNKDGTTSETIEVKAGTTLYNETKKMTGSGSAEKVKALKAINPTVKNAVTKTTNIKIHNNPNFVKITDMAKQKPSYVSAIKPPSISATHDSMFGRLTWDEITKKSGSITSARPTHCFWDRYGNVYTSKGGN